MTLLLLLLLLTMTRAPDRSSEQSASLYQRDDLLPHSEMYRERLPVTDLGVQRCQYNESVLTMTGFSASCSCC